MNVVVLIGRLTRDPEVRYSQQDQTMEISRYTLAVNRGYQEKEGEPSADFIPCVAFGKRAEFAEKYFRQGMKVAVTGRIQTGSYVNREGRKIYTTDIFIDTQEFADSKKTETQKKQRSAPEVDENGFMNIPDGIDEELPFS